MNIALIAGILLLAITRCPAVEGLRIAVQCPDVVLSWTGAENETCIVQYPPTLKGPKPFIAEDPPPLPSNYFELLNLPTNYLDTLSAETRRRLSLP
ncbi:MAG TPA: hypothetical protein VHH88_07470 [Verrucomicrobiae bacterium]|nr:hypothetical protein [Verrucomicrobiae bacterium]